MRHPRLLPAIALLLLFSCKQNTDTPPEALTEHMVLVEATDSAVENEIADSASVPEAALVLDTTDLSPEPDTPLKLLLEGSFHKQEVWAGADKKQWLGLFKEDGKYILRPTLIQVNIVEDPVTDSAGILSGREVVAADSNAIFLLTGLQPGKAGAVDTAVFATAILPANKELLYTFKGREYRISSYGDSTQAATGEYAYQNYGWKVSGTRNGKEIEQTLAEDEGFTESIYVLLWAGDLDQDGIPDLLIDLSNHYNVSSYTLFLSSKADRGKLYKKVAVFETTGC
jgi:hypothetical protein